MRFQPPVEISGERLILVSDMKVKWRIGLLIVFLAAVSGLLASGDGYASEAGREAGSVRSPVFKDVEAQTREFIRYYNEIKLTPKEQKIKERALTTIAAPCCDKYSAFTCCCVCNLSRSIWGLSNHLIRNGKYTSEELRGAVLKWIAFINPRGYSGDACFTGGCGRPFRFNGCGGMKEENLVL